MRSSAIGEDTLFSFAGQYASYLNVNPDELIDRYREILASKFTPKAIYYFLSHFLSEAELAMSVGCVSMIDALASGVVYTCDPVNPDDETVLIHSIFGLGKYLVNGNLEPDVFSVSRDSGEIIKSTIAHKPVRLVMCHERGTREEPVAPEDQDKPSLNKEHIRQLTEYALNLENHYRGPQDIEWAVDRKGRLFLLQSRPLQVIKSPIETVSPDLSGHPVLMSGGTTVCPGAGSGPVHHIISHKDLPGVPSGAVLVAPNPFPGMITVISKINALVTRIGSLASHMATIAREYHVPTLVGLEDALDLNQGRQVTVDATGRVIYDGDIPELIEVRQPEFESLEISSIYRVLDKVLDLVSPLRLLHPTDQDFLPENCVTYHDITRYAHQMAMEEMFLSARQVEGKMAPGCKLKCKFPADINIFFIDRTYPDENGKTYITEDELDSLPMDAIWNGIVDEGWPAQPRLTRPVRTIGTALTDTKQPSLYSQSSFAIISRQYMILSLRMGYHFTTVEAMCTDEENKNYIQMQYKEGGATLDRRIRRVKLLSDILSLMGFVQHHKVDYLNSMLTYQEKGIICEKLHLLGRLLMMTKQLDMALSNDAVAKWYTEDIIKRLGLKNKSRSVSNPEDKETN
jgi:pyruvate,water dikinase